MRGMNSGSVDLIYLDPPFNSNANYAAPIGSKAAGAAFKDTWGLDDINLAWHGMIKYDEPGLYAMLNATQMIHSDSMMSYLIYMAVWVMEMKRIIKPAGNLFLHCDPTASHYLKAILDAIFRQNHFRSEIIWRRASGRAKGSQHKSKRLGSDTDSIFHYSLSENATWHGIHRQLTQKEIVAKFRHVEPKTSRRYNTDVPIFSAPSMGSRPNLCYTYKGITNPHPSGWRVSKETLTKLDNEGRIIWRKGKTPLRKSYADEYQGQPVGSLWLDIPIASGKERTGYPTQKPLKLIERIITAASNSDDMVLDPFCGCATACIAAERTGRQWAGIDISPKAVDLVQDRLQTELGIFWQGAARTDIPIRTDLGKIPKYNSKENKTWLYGEQQGYCHGCGDHFEMRILEIDHIIPKSKGGTDHRSNLQLLCSHCNRVKGNRSQEYLLKCLTDKGWRKQTLVSVSI